ncbi:hypothetical protein GQ43DRAFT_378169, partial [Delitschia confertaspora ATCC 74209]
GSNTFTANMDIKLRGCITTPGVYLVRAFADKDEAKRTGQNWQDMRKIWARAEIQNGNGEVLTEAKYLFLKAKEDGKL